MKYVDQIIRYLSGEMSEEESSSFRNMLASEKRLREEYEEVSAAYRLIREEIRKKEREDFREKVKEAMEPPGIASGRWPSNTGKWLFYLLTMAASLAILFVILQTESPERALFSKFYKPDKDPVVNALGHDTRGNILPGISLYNRGELEESRRIMEKLMTSDPENQVAIIYYILASIELDMEKEALARIRPIEIESGHYTGRCLTWYIALALLKSGRSQEAADQLLPLVSHPGPYEKEARRLKNKLLK